MDQTVRMDGTLVRKNICWRQYSYRLAMQKHVFVSWRTSKTDQHVHPRCLIRAFNVRCQDNEVQKRLIRLYTVDPRYLEIQGTLWNTSRYPYFDILDLRNWRKQLFEQPPLTEWICNLTPKLEIYWKYCGQEEKLLLGAIFSAFPQYFVACW